MPDIKISVAMTTYNGEKYITAQLDSLRMQSRRINEVIICDDGSSDATAEIVKNYIRDHWLYSWHLVRNEHNLGFVENFRQAVSLTHGDLIFLCDQDDEWELNKVSVMAKTFRRNPNICALMTSIALINENSDPIEADNGLKWLLRMRNAQPDSLMKVDFMELCCENFAPGCTMAFTRQAADEYIAMENEEKIFHDWLLAVLAAKRGGLYMLFTPLVKYRIHTANAIGSPLTKEQVKEASRRRGRQTELGIFYGLRKRVELGIGGAYEDQEMLRNNVKYIDTRIALYTKKTLPNLLRALAASRKAKNVTQNKFRTNCRDILFFLGLICKDE